MDKNLVYIEKQNVFAYPQAPFDPNRLFPEFNGSFFVKKLNRNNKVYEMLRNSLICLDLDQENFGGKNWKPFKDLIKPGGHIVIKPNFVKGDHPLGKIGVESMITHASIIRPIIDYLLLSTGNNCKITICDVPLQSSVWENIINKSGTKDLVEYYKSMGIEIDLLDLRKEISCLNDEAVIYKRDIKDRDPLGYASVDLGRKSALMPVIEKHKDFMITDYDKGTVAEHHNPYKNEYFVAKTILDADLFINIPKLKTHRKAGLTAAAKNLIGMNGDKRWIAHHMEGSQKIGGDEFPKLVFRDWFEFRLFSFLKRSGTLGVWMATIIRKCHRTAYMIKRAIKSLFFTSGKAKNTTNLSTEDDYFWSFETFKKKFPKATYQVFRELNPTAPRYLEGSWYGNDTIWRTIMDLNNIIFYSDKDGILEDNVQRNYFCIVDGILAGEKEGPMEHTPKRSGIIIGGFHPLSVDFTSAKIMGFDYKKIPSISNMFSDKIVNFLGLRPDNIKIKSNIDIEKIDLKFKPTINWKGHIEA